MKKLFPGEDHLGSNGGVTSHYDKKMKYFKEILTKASNLSYHSK